VLEAGIAQRSERVDHRALSRLAQLGAPAPLRERLLEAAARKRAHEQRGALPQQELAASAVLEVRGDVRRALLPDRERPPLLAVLHAEGALELRGAAR
jgi:hypothetical protein